MDAIFRWLANALAAILEKFADPQLQKKLDEYDAKVATAEAKEQEAKQAEAASLAAYQLSVNRRKELDRLLQISEAQENALQQQLTASQLRVKQIQDEADKAKKLINDLSDHDAIRGDV